MLIGHFMKLELFSKITEKPVVRDEKPLQQSDMFIKPKLYTGMTKLKVSNNFQISP